MNRRIRALALAMMACYVALFVRLNLLTVVEAPELNSRPDNSRVVQAAFNKPRGDIVSADGKLLATSVETDGTLRYQRTYPAGDLFGQVTGSYSFLFGSDGVEKQYDDELRGDTAEFALRGLAAPLVEGPNVGTVELTLRSDVQEAARRALGDRRGSVVVIDPRSGDILAMWSWPSYDPNLVAANDEIAAAGVPRGLQRRWRQADAGQDLPGALLPGIDVQGGDRGRGTRERNRHGDIAGVSRGHLLHAAAHHPATVELRRLDLRWGLVRGSRGVVQFGIRRDGCGDDRA